MKPQRHKGSVDWKWHGNERGWSLLLDNVLARGGELFWLWFLTQELLIFGGTRYRIKALVDEVSRKLVHLTLTTVQIRL